MIGFQFNDASVDACGPGVMSVARRGAAILSGEIKRSHFEQFRLNMLKKLYDYYTRKESGNG